MQQNNFWSVISLTALLLVGTALQAQDFYGFDVAITEQQVCTYDQSLADEDGFAPCQNVPIITPPYSNNTPVSGFFAYDSTQPGRIVSCTPGPTGPANPACVSFGVAIPSITVNVAENIFERTNLWLSFSDATAVMPGFGEPTQDVLFSLSVTGTIVQSFPVVVDGVPYTTRSANIFFLEGPTGTDFFPDIALLDPPVFFGLSSATAPPLLPPTGANLHRFTMSFEGGEIAPGITTYYYLRGTLVLNGEMLTADINVNPYKSTNEVKPASDDPIVVAVHSTSIAGGDTTDFDALQVDPESLKLGLGEAPNIASPWIVDADSDGDVNDVLFAFRTQASGVFCGDTDITLTGETYSGVPFAAMDTISTSDCFDTGCHPPAD
jgi:hypothetical protein